MTQEERQREREYRRGFCDGWAEGIQAVIDGVPAGTLAHLGERGRQVYAAYSRAEKHWSQALNPWAAGDCGISQLPPELPEGDGGGVGDSDRGDIDEESGELELGELEAEYEPV